MEMKKIDPTVYVQVKLRVMPQHEYSVTHNLEICHTLSLSLKDSYRKPGKSIKFLYLFVMCKGLASTCLCNRQLPRHW